jgi:hypothetical protein
VRNRIINSRLFKFTVGEEIDGTATEFSVHEGAIAQLSTPLKALTQGDSPEAEAGHATWKDVSKDTFERFSQFAYTGDYSIPKTEKRNTEGVLTPPSSPAATVSSITRGRKGSVSSTTQGRNGSEEKSTQPLFDNELGREPVIDKPADDDGTILNQPTLIKKTRKKGRRKNSEVPTMPDPVVAEPPPPEPQPEQVPEAPELAEPESVEPEPTPAEPEQNRERPDPELLVDFPTLSFPLCAERDNYHGTCEPSADFEKDHSYSKVLLSHASLYVLGDLQLIDSLKALALFKLHKTLCTFQLETENIGDITDLARYTYSKEGKGGIEGLRGLVSEYMGIHAMELSKDVKFMTLLAEGGQIVKDFFKVGLQRRH